MHWFGYVLLGLAVLLAVYLGIGLIKDIKKAKKLREEKQSKGETPTEIKKGV